MFERLGPVPEHRPRRQHDRDDNERAGGSSNCHERDGNERARSRHSHPRYVFADVIV